MNRKLLALAVTAALAAPFAAQAAPTVYGQLNMSIDKVNVDNGPDQFEVNSNASRLGVMGEESLGNGYSAVYKVEGEVDGDGATTWDFKDRDRYLGLKANWGTLKLGNFDSPLKSSQGGVDQFNDMKHLDMGQFIYGEDRMANLIGYDSPKIADAVTVKVAIQPGEDSSPNGSNGLADVVSAAVAYDTDALHLALAVNMGDGQGANAGTDRDTIRLTGTYTMDALQIGALLQTSKLSDGAVDQKQDSILLGAAYTMGKNVFRGEVISSTEDDLGPDSQDTLAVAIGMDHNFTQMTKVYAQYGMAKVSNDGGVTGVDVDASVLSVGMLTKF